MVIMMDHMFGNVVGIFVCVMIGTVVGVVVGVPDCMVRVTDDKVACFDGRIVGIFTC